MADKNFPKRCTPLFILFSSSLISSFIQYLHKCYKVLRFDRKILEGYVPSLIPRLEYSGQVELVDGKTTSILSAYEKTDGS